MNKKKENKKNQHETDENCKELTKTKIARCVSICFDHECFILSFMALFI